jgi:HK97 family phage major capsid protein
VIISEYCAQLGSFGDVALADFSQVLFTQKRDIEGSVSIHVNFDFDEQVFKFTWRLDSQPMWHTAVQPANGCATLSPYIALAARS